MKTQEHLDFDISQDVNNSNSFNFKCFEGITLILNVEELLAVSSDVFML